jgi:hypothetical protein
MVVSALDDTFMAKHTADMPYLHQVSPPEPVEYALTDSTRYQEKLLLTCDVASLDLLAPRLSTYCHNLVLFVRLWKLRFRFLDPSYFFPSSSSSSATDTFGS